MRKRLMMRRSHSSRETGSNASLYEHLDEGRRSCTMIYNRRSFVRGLGLFGCALPLTALAQHDRQPRVRRIGYLTGNLLPTLTKAFEEEMHNLGYIEGENIVIEKRFHSSDDLDARAAELSHMNLELIVAGALPQALAVRKNNTNSPMVIGTCPGMISRGAVPHCGAEC